MSSGNQGLLHKNKLEAFGHYLKLRGYIEVEAGSHTYEVARFRRQGVDLPIIIYRRERIDHLTVVNGFHLLEEYYSCKQHSTRSST